MESPQTAVELESEPSDRGVAEADRIFGWRLESLKRAGYHDDAAFRAALYTAIDLHLALRLLDRGCSAETAARILL